MTSWRRTKALTRRDADGQDIRRTLVRAVTAPSDQWVWLAIIRRPQGRKGEVFADLLTDFPDRFSERKRLWLLRGEDAPASAQLPPREMALETYWPHKGGVVLQFAGIDSISAADLLKGLIVAIPRSERVPLGQDEAYIADLVGCTLFDVSGAEPVMVGVIDNVDRTAGPVAQLIVHSESTEILVPFAKSYLRKIDLEARRIEMDIPEGLINLNE